MRKRQRHNLILGIYLNVRGFAFVLFEGPFSPVDWGIIEIRGKNRIRRSIGRIGDLFGRYQPDALVLQNMSVSGERRAKHIRTLNEAIKVLAGTQSIPIYMYSRAQVRDYFKEFGLTSKDAIAETIARKIPMLERLVPSRRKIWNSENARMVLFDAVAIVLLFFRDALQQNK
jgi:hypothetical protein